MIEVIKKLRLNVYDLESMDLAWLKEINDYAKKIKDSNSKEVLWKQVLAEIKVIIPR